MIKVGVFWASVLLNVDIIFDVEEYPDDYQSKDILLTYSKQHKDVWEKLSKEQCGGRYTVVFPESVGKDATEGARTCFMSYLLALGAMPVIFALMEFVSMFFG